MSSGSGFVTGMVVGEQQAKISRNIAIDKCNSLETRTETRTCLDELANQHHHNESVAMWVLGFVIFLIVGLAVFIDM